MDTIKGIVSKIAWKSPDSDRVILSVGYESGGAIEEGKIAVNARGVEPGDAFVATGEWGASRLHSKVDNLFKGKTFTPAFPATKAGLERFLFVNFSANKHGLDRERLKALASENDASFLEKMAADPELLVSHSSDPARFRSAIRQTVSSKTQGQEAIRILNEAGVSPRTSSRIMAFWRNDALRNLKNNPWIAARVPKVEFKEADSIAQHMGFSIKDPKRLTEAVLEVLAGQDGSTCANVDTLLEHVEVFAGTSKETLNSFLQDLTRKGGTGEFYAFNTSLGPVASIHKFYTAEVRTVRRLTDLVSTGRRNKLAEVEKKAEELFRRKEFSRFDEVQRTAVKMAVSEPISIVTGGPGTGKSTVMEAVAALAEMFDDGPLFFIAPVGKAAKRLAETTGRETSTAHRLLKAGVNDDGETFFKMSKNNPLPKGCFVVMDETSMTDVELMDALTDALPADARILLTGDDGQLPPVGKGSPFADMLAARTSGSQVIPSVKLQQVYRQDKDSGIAKGAAEIRKGKIPELSAEQKAGVSFQSFSPSQIVDEVEDLVCNVLAKKGYDPLKEIAVLVPQAPGPGGTHEINRRLSARLNPNGARIPGVEKNPDFDDEDTPIPRVGDRVMLTENNAQFDVMNGEVGTITGVGRSDKGLPTIKVEFDAGTKFECPVSNWRKLILAYAGTIHKSQGSQYPVVIMPMVEAHTKMLDREIVYTGWTRAQKSLYLLGDKAAFDTAVVRTRSNDRLTLLRNFLSRINVSKISNLVNWEKKAGDAQATLDQKLPKPLTPVRVNRSPFGSGKRRRPAAAASVVSSAIPSAHPASHGRLPQTARKTATRGLGFGLGRRGTSPSDVDKHAPQASTNANRPAARPLVNRRLFGRPVNIAASDTKTENYGAQETKTVNQAGLAGVSETGAFDTPPEKKVVKPVQRRLFGLRKPNAPSVEKAAETSVAMKPAMEASPETSGPATIPARRGGPRRLFGLKTPSPKNAVEEDKSPSP